MSSARQGPYSGLKNANECGLDEEVRGISLTLGALSGTGRAGLPVYSEDMVRALAALILLVLPAAGQKTSTAADIAALVRSELQAKRSDTKIAKSLRNV